MHSAKLTVLGVVRLALRDWLNVACCFARKQLTWASDLVLWVADHLVELCNPTRGPCQRKYASEQVHRYANGTLHDAGVKVDVGVELA